MAGRINHKTHAHASTPSARALCRASGGTSAAAKKAFTPAPAAGKRSSSTTTKSKTAKLAPQPTKTPGRGVQSQSARDDLAARIRKFGPKIGGNLVTTPRNR